MQIDPIYFYFFVGLSVLMTYLFVKRLGNNGCFSFGYIGLIIFSVNVFVTMSSVFLYSSVKDVYNAMTSGQKYDATVVSYTSERHYDSDDNRSYLMHTPTVQFTTESGETIEKRLDFSTSGLEIGDPYSVNYNSENDTIITLGFMLVIKVIGAFIFSFIFTFLFIGIVLYILAHPMKGYTSFVSKIGFYFFIPFLMIGFNALLIYGALYGNEVPRWVTAVLIFFSVALALGTFGYLKMMFTKGTPKMKHIDSKTWKSFKARKNKERLR